MFGIINKLHFNPGNVSLQKRISEIYAFDIEWDSTKHSGNTIFHVQPWNYDDDAMENQEIQVMLPLAPTVTSSKKVVVSLTQNQSELLSRKITAFPDNNLIYNTTVTPTLHSIQHVEFSDKYLSKLTDSFNHNTSQDILDLMPARTSVLDRSRETGYVRHFRGGRVLQQLYHKPITYDNSSDVKTVYLPGHQGHWHQPAGMAAFNQCLIDACSITYDKNYRLDADAVLFSNPATLPVKPPFHRKSTNQVWVISMIEAPLNSKSLKYYKGLFNWTMTYRFDSVIETPYFKYKTNNTRERIQSEIQTNYAAGKSKKVAWIVSNCLLARSGRMKYAKELAKHIDVDIYGACGTKRCPRKEDGKCMQMLEKDYKFFLAFENSKCVDYVTEKPVRALQYVHIFIT